MGTRFLEDCRTARIASDSWVLKCIREQLGGLWSRGGRGTKGNSAAGSLASALLLGGGPASEARSSWGAGEHLSRKLLLQEEPEVKIRGRGSFQAGAPNNSDPIFSQQFSPHPKENKHDSTMMLLGGGGVLAAAAGQPLLLLLLQVRCSPPLLPSSRQPQKVTWSHPPSLGSSHLLLPRPLLSFQLPSGVRKSS